MMRVQTGRNILEDSPVYKLGEGKAKNLAVTEGFSLTHKTPFRILNPRKSNFLSIHIIAFGDPNYDEEYPIGKGID
jgi:hypothetical protein